MGWVRNMFTRRTVLDGRAGLVYREGTLKLTVDSEMLVGPDFDMVVYLNRITSWDPPHQDVVLDASDKKRIRKNICSDLGTDKIDWC